MANKRRCRAFKPMVPAWLASHPPMAPVTPLTASFLQTNMTPARNASKGSVAPPVQSLVSRPLQKPVASKTSIHFVAMQGPRRTAFAWSRNGRTLTTRHQFRPFFTLPLCTRGEASGPETWFELLQRPSSNHASCLPSLPLLAWPRAAYCLPLCIHQTSQAMVPAAAMLTKSPLAKFWLHTPVMHMRVIWLHDPHGTGLARGERGVGRGSPKAEAPSPSCSSSIQRQGRPWRGVVFEGRGGHDSWPRCGD
ncbi:hypothetical protein IWZ01DRAFT_66058 [Phyllosticta capitalensis]